jgi:hypothetical protein
MKIKIIITLSIAFIMTTCSKENKCGDGKTYYNLSENDKSQIPYKGSEILKFLNTSSSDTLIFQAEPEWSYYTNSKYYGADCPMENICQGRGIAFFNASQNKKIVINHLYRSDINVEYIELNYNDIFTVNETFPFINMGKPTYDSVNINGIFYYNVRAITGKIKQPKDVGFWFTEKEGILKIYSNINDTLTRVK